MEVLKDPKETACCSSSVFRSGSRKAIHQSLSQAHNICRSRGECQSLRFDQRGDVGKAVSMKLKNRVSVLPCGEEEYERI